MKQISSIHNPAVLALRGLQRAKGRRERGEFLCEGAKMVREALALGLCRSLIVEQGREADYAAECAQAQQRNLPVLLVTAPVMQAVCEAKTPQGIAATVAVLPEPAGVSGNLLVALDGVQDPGNVGTILRTADAAGFEGALLSDACADLYSAKTLRATMGSVFRLPVCRTPSLADALQALRAQGYAIVATELGGADFYAHCPHARCVLVIGSEGQGVSAAVRGVATHHLALPMRGGAESLNAAVAAGIMMYEMARGSGKNG